MNQIITNKKPSEAPQSSKTFLAILSIMIILSFLSFSTALIWNSTTFNNSLASENLSFAGGDNLTRWLQIPNTVNFLSSGFFNLSGYLAGDYAHHGEIMTVDGGSVGYSAGLVIIPNEEVILKKVSLVSGVTASTVKVFLSNGTLVASAPITNLNATFNTNLSRLHKYYILANHTTNYNRWLNDTTTLPVNTTFILFNNSIYDENSFTQVYSSTFNIAGINVVTTSNLTEIYIGGTKSSDIQISSNGSVASNVRSSNLASLLTNSLNSTYLIGTNYLIPFIFGSALSGNITYLDLFFSNENYTENSQAFQNLTYDTSREIFELNVSYDSSRYTDATATLIYNNTRISSTSVASGNDRIFTAEKDIEVVYYPINNTVYWELALTDAGGQKIFNLSSANQTVNPSNFTQCGTTNPAVNYTTYDEENQTRLVTNFDATFEWRLNKSSSITKNISYNFTGQNSYKFCINTNRTFYTDVDIDLSASGYTSRTFGFNLAEFSNDTTIQPLYLLNDTLGTNVIIKLKDIGLFPLSNYTIQIFRKLASGTEIMVENDITDHIGQVVARLIENEVKYKIIFYNQSNDIVKSIPTAIIACTTTKCQQTFIVQTLTNAFDDFDTLEDHTSTLTFNNNTRTFSFIWVDNRGEDQTHRLLIEKITFANGTEVVYNGTSTSDSSVLTYIADTSKANYRASAFRKVGSDEDRLFVLNVNVGDTAGTFSFEGLYWSFIIFMLMLLVGKFHPPTGIILYLFTVFLLGIFGIIFINPAIIVAELVIGVIFIWSWKG